MRKILKNNNLPLRLEKDVFNQCVISTLCVYQKDEHLTRDRKIANNTYKHTQECASNDWEEQCHTH